MNSDARYTEMDDLSKFPLWKNVFDMDGIEPGHARSFASDLTVKPEDIYTAKLRMTRDFYKSVESRNISVMPGCIGSFEKVIDILAIIGTFQNMARARLGDMVAPSFWVRKGSALRDVRPAFAIEAAAKVCGMDVSMLRAGLVPLVKDGAIELIRSPDGVTAIVLAQGYIADNAFRRYYKV